jgi:hypothetical protein
MSLDELLENGNSKDTMDLEEFIRKTKGLAYKKRALMWFQANLGKIVTSNQLAVIPGRDENPISHNIRRIFELRDEDGYEIANHKDNEKTSLNLRVDEWVLLKKDPNPDKIRERGVNKRIMFEVFSRDGYQCQICGRTKDDDDPFKEGHKIKLHVGHLEAHKSKSGTSSKKKLTPDDFITMCNVCNEGAKNNDVKVITLLDRVKKADEEVQTEIYEFLEEKFKTVSK